MLMVMGVIFTDTLKINSSKPIFKISNSSFSFGFINYDSFYVKNICNLLDLGTKFIPFLTENYFNYFNSIYKSLDNSLLELNRQFFINKVNANSNSYSSSSQDFSTHDSFSFSKQNLNSHEILKSLNKKRKPNYENIPLQREIIDVRFDLIKNLNNKKPDLGSNISQELRETLKHFNKNKPFSVIQCDKNVGCMLISNDDLYNLANNHLEGNNTYKAVNENEVKSIFDQVNFKLNNLYMNKDISKELKSKLILEDIKDYSVGKFRILAKIHKKDFNIRPIINCGNNFTYKISLFIHLLINPHVQSLTHILKDSQELLQKLENFKSNNSLHLYSCDFESLYTNIIAEHASNIISYYLFSETNLLSQFNLSLNGVRELILLVFNCNIFIFNNKHYIQKIGLPMGCICGPSIANLFVYILERKWLNLNKEKIYFRFIDDIFLASSSLLNLKNFESQFEYLRLNIESNNSVNFLDLVITFDCIIGKFNFSLYIKPTNTFSYLLPNSNHPKHIFRNIPVSLFTRIRRICSSYIDYLHFSRLLLIQLLKRGYKLEIISGIIRSIGNVERNSLLPYKDKNQNKFLTHSSCKLFIEYDNCNFFFNYYLSYLFKRLTLNNTYKFNKKLVIINKVQTNIGALLIHGFKLNKSTKNHYKDCENRNCFICMFSSKYFYLNINNFFLPFQNLSSCNSYGIIYIICCFKCNCFYIGESGRSVKERISEHLSNIKSFNKNLLNSIIKLNENSLVAQHFNFLGHNLEEDFRFLIFESNVTNTTIRKSIETDLINLFKTFHISILNNINKQPKKEKISYLTFQT